MRHGRREKKILLTPGEPPRQVGPSPASHFCPGLSGNFSEFSLFSLVVKPEYNHHLSGLVECGKGCVEARPLGKKTHAR